MADLVKIRRAVGTPFEGEAEVRIDELATSIGSNLEYLPESALTLSDRHQGKCLAVTSACSVTVPVGLRKGFSCGWLQAGSGQVTFVAGSGVTLRSQGAHLKSIEQWAAGGVAAIETDVYLLYGGLGS